jgi:hypothetical protein
MAELASVRERMGSGKLPQFWVVGQFDQGFIADAMNVCLKARNSQANR